jgi:tetratricopeptide (TPR) repeat protein
MPWKSPSPHRHRLWLAVIVVLAFVAVGLLGYAISRQDDAAGPAGVPGEPSQPLDQRAADLEDQLADAIRHERVEALLPKLRALAREHPDQPAARNLLGKGLLAVRQHEPAYEQFSASLEVDPDQPEIQLLAGTLAMQTDRPVDAGRHYNEAVRLDPDNTSYQMHLVQAYLAQQRYDQARDLLLKLLRQDSTSPEAYAGLADVYARQNKLELALTHMDRALEYAADALPGKRHAYLRKKAALLRRDNRPEEALLVLRQLPAAERARPEVLEELAVTHMMLGQPRDAAALYERAFAVTPTDWRLAAGAARWYLKAGDLDAAGRFVDHVQRINPRAPVLDRLRAELDEAR